MDVRSICAVFLAFALTSDSAKGSAESLVHFRSKFSTNRLVSNQFQDNYAIKPERDPVEDTITLLGAMQELILSIRSIPDIVNLDLMTKRRYLERSSNMLIAITQLQKLGNDRKSTAETMKMLSKGLMKLDAVIANIERKALRLTPRQKKGILNKTAIRLGNLAKAEVKLIIMRTGEQGAQIDSLISQINDKSYELKMALIQLQQTNGPTSYFPAVQAVLTPNFPSILHRNSRAGKQSANDLYLRLEK